MPRSSLMQSLLPSRTCRRQPPLLRSTPKSLPMQSPLLLFLLSKPNVTVLTLESQTRSSESSWARLFNMVINAVNHNFIESYGCVTLPLEAFSNSKVRQKLKHFRPFGCPVYQVNNEIQAGNNHPKGLSWAKPVIYLGSSPCHARSVLLVLDLETVHVSPQLAHRAMLPRCDNLRQPLQLPQLRLSAEVLLSLSGDLICNNLLHINNLFLFK
jgi:hypothetical protein